MLTLKQFVITPAAGKRLIAKTLANHPAIRKALKNGTLVIVAGTTNGYVAEEILKTHQIACDFSRKHFFRGITLPSKKSVTGTGRLSDVSAFPGDVVIVKGVWQKGKSIEDVVDSLKEGDVILKGANALDLTRRQAAILIGHSEGWNHRFSLASCCWTSSKTHHTRGLGETGERRFVSLAGKLNAPGACGSRLLPVPGEVFTELDALAALTGACVELIASGGVCGAEGACWLAVSGNEEQEEYAEQIVASVANEPAFSADYL